MQINYEIYPTKKKAGLTCFNFDVILRYIRNKRESVEWEMAIADQEWEN